MTLVYRPEPGSKGSALQAKREALALLHALEDPRTYASLLRQHPEQAIGLTEEHAVEVGVTFEVVDGVLIATAFETVATLEA